eukprot:4779013-Prymnesium_polylepis.1
MFALTSIKGVGRRFSNVACKKAEVDLNKRCGAARTRPRRAPGRSGAPSVGHMRRVARWPLPCTHGSALGVRRMPSLVGQGGRADR